MEYTTVNRVLSKFNRDLKGTLLNERDAIEWIGEALDFLKVHAVLEPVVSFIEVKDYECPVPPFLHLVTQVAKDNSYVSGTTLDPDSFLVEVENEDDPPHICMDCQDGFINDYYVTYYRPYPDLIWEYYPWTMSSAYQARFSPIRLSNNTFFKNVVCKEKGEIYQNCKDEYTIVGTTERKLRFSFREGAIAISYLRTAVDPKTGYPLVPDDVRFITAISYYLQWKIAEWYNWSGREGFSYISQDAERKWLKYAKQAKNYAKMPKSLDDYQDLLEQSHYLVPDYNQYYSFFGSLNNYEQLNF